jgi:hypothetical protein
MENLMSKLLHALKGGAALLMLASGLAAAADSVRPSDEPLPLPRASENQPGESAPVVTSPDQANQDEQYMAALRKCDSLSGADKQKCTDAAQRKFGRM